MLSVVLFFLVSLPNIVSQREYRTVPLRFDVAIDQLLQHQQFTLHEIDRLSYSITPAEMLASFSASSNSNTTTKCYQDFLLLFEAAVNRELWALKILDAWGKPVPSGLLKGNRWWVGNYDECLDSLYQPENKTFLQQPFDGQYCSLLLSGIMPPQILTRPLFLGICAPSSCNRQSILSLVQSLFNNSNITEEHVHCSNDDASKQKSLSRGAIATCVVLSLLGLLVLVGTIIDLVRDSYLESVSHIASHMSEHNKILAIEMSEIKSATLLGHPQSPTNPILDTIEQFSAVRTLRRIFTMKMGNNHDSFDFLNGLRVLSLFWVIFGRTFGYYVNNASNFIDVLASSQNIAFQLIVSSLFSVDTFFVVSGFLTAILFVRQITKEKLTFRSFILYYIHRYIRLTPTFILVILVSINLTPYFGGGPLYPSKQGFESDGCSHRGWWTSILYIANLFKIGDMCLSGSWYLQNDMQFHWIAPLALIPFVIGRQLIAFIVATLFVLIGIGSVIGILLYYPNINLNTIAGLFQRDGVTYYTEIYIKPWGRISAYAIGLLIGFIVINTGRSYRSNIYTKIFGSLLAVILGLTCILVIYPDYVLVPGLSRSALIVYHTLSRPCWALLIGWLIFLCSTKQGGIVNTILSWPIWAPLARLNYSAYLINSTIILITMLNQTMPIYVQPHMIVNIYISNLFFSYIAAIVVVIFFETPFFVLEKKLF
ncbi:unnamed protein product [Rotaria sp. Silwood2]|nr:unnamed protein product [Rotaria sp. Silwood2]